MKVTICAKHFLPKGGAQTFMIAFARALIERGHEVRVLALNGRPMDGVSLTVLKQGWWVPKFARDWLHGLRLARALRDDPPDASFGEQKMWDCSVVRPGGGAQKEYVRQNMLSYGPLRLPMSLLRAFSLKDRFNLAAERNAYRSPHLRRVITNSRLVMRDLLRYYPELDGRIVVIHNGSNLARFDPADRERFRGPVLDELGLRRDGVTALFAGNNFRLKGVRQAIEAVALARRAEPGFPLQLIVMGKAKTGWFRRYARRLGLGDVVRFTGRTAHPERYYVSADALLFPSFHDPCANVTMEALSAGLPVLTTVFNGGHEVLTHGVNGWVVSDPRDVAAMADCLLELRSEARREELRRAARALAEEHPLEEKLAQVIAVLEEAAEENRRRGGH